MNFSANHLKGMVNLISLSIVRVEPHFNVNFSGISFVCFFLYACLLLPPRCPHWHRQRLASVYKERRVLKVLWLKPQINPWDKPANLTLHYISSFEVPSYKNSGLYIYHCGFFYAYFSTLEKYYGHI